MQVLLADLSRRTPAGVKWSCREPFGETQTYTRCCRLASLNAMSRSGQEPGLSLWEESGTLLQTISYVSIRDEATGQLFKMYFATGADAGHNDILALLTDSRYTCSEVNGFHFLTGCLSKSFRAMSALRTRCLQGSTCSSSRYQSCQKLLKDLLHH